jgi:hypothetical protein
MHCHNFTNIPELGYLYVKTLLNKKGFIWFEIFFEYEPVVPDDAARVCG